MLDDSFREIVQFVLGEVLEETCWRHEDSFRGTDVIWFREMER